MSEAQTQAQPETPASQHLRAQQQQAAEAVQQAQQQQQQQQQQTQQQHHQPPSAQQPQTQQQQATQPQTPQNEQQQQQLQEQQVLKQSTPVSSQQIDGSGQSVQPQTLIINTTNIAQQQQPQNQVQIPQWSAAGTISTLQPGLSSVPLQHSTAGTITTMSALQQQQQQQQLQQQQQQQQQQQLQQQQQSIQNQANQAIQQTQIQQLSGWGPERVQVIQSPIPNSNGYVGPYLMSGNIAVQNQNGQIQLIAGAKPIQSNQPLQPMFAQSKQLIQGQAASFPQFSIPTSNNQTILIGGLLGNQNIIPAQSVAAVTTSKAQELQKYNACASNRTVPQGAQPLQVSQWQFSSVPPNLWSSSQPTIITQNGSVFLRGTPPDGSGQVQQAPVFVQQSPPPQHIQSQHAQGIVQNQSIQNITQIANPINSVKRPPDNIQPKVAVARTFNNILPAGTTAIRPGSSVSTQTTPATQMPQYMQKSHQPKVRAKTNVVSRTGSMMTQKLEASKSQIPQQIAGQAKNMMVQYMTDPKNPQVLQSVSQSVKMQPTQLSQQQVQVQQQQIIQQQISLQQQQLAQTGIFQQPQQLIQPKPASPPLLISSQTPQQIQIAHMQQQNSDQMTQQMMMPVVSVPGITSCQSSQLLVMPQQQPQPPQTQLQPQISQQPQPQAQAIVSTDGTAVTLTQNTQPLLDVSTNMQGVQPLAPPIIPPPASVAIKEDDQQPSGIATTNAGLVASIDSSASSVVIAAPVQSSTLGPAASTALMGDNKAEAVEGILTPGGTMKAENVVETIPVVEEGVKDKMLPKALVKPQVLTHVIEGHLIQEADEPFPVYRSVLMADPMQTSRNEKDKLKSEDEHPVKKQKMDTKEYGKNKSKKGKKGNNNFKRINGDAKNGKINSEWEGSENNDSGPESFSSPSESHDGTMDVDENGNQETPDDTDSDTLKVNPYKWTSREVRDFIFSLPGVTVNCADEFVFQEIDGQALMLLKVQHLTSIMNMTLGLALKVMAKIDSMREDTASSSRSDGM